MTRKAWFGGILLLVFLADPAAAHDAPMAIGRISYGNTFTPGSAICTGVLVAPDLVLTARHCVADAQTNPGTVRFAAGFADGHGAAVGQGAEVILSESPVTKSRANDVALLRLDAPIAGSAATPLPLADPVSPLQLSVIAYRRDAPERAERQDDCKLLTVLPGMLALSCPVVSGYSGAPVLAWDGTGWQVLAIVVASASGDPVHSLAAVVPPDLLARINAAVQP